MLELSGFILAFLPETDLRLCTELSDTSLKMCLEAHWMNERLQLHAAQQTGVIITVVGQRNATSGFPHVSLFKKNYINKFFISFLNCAMNYRIQCQLKR